MVEVPLIRPRLAECGDFLIAGNLGKGKVMRRWVICLFVVVGVLAGTVTAQAAIMWYTGDGTGITAGKGQTAESDFQAAVALLGLPLAVQDFEGYSHGNVLNTIPIGGLTVDLKGRSADGSTVQESLRVFKGSYGVPNQKPGTVNGNALLPGNTSPLAQLELHFPIPVSGLGLWVFDNAASQVNKFRMGVWETGAVAYSYSGFIDDISGSTAHTVEGFLGAVSATGIDKVVVQNYTYSPDALTDTYFEIDHVQQAVIPEPGSAIVWGLFAFLGFGLGWWRRRR